MYQLSNWSWKKASNTIVMQLCNENFMPHAVKSLTQIKQCKKDKVAVFIMTDNVNIMILGIAFTVIKLKTKSKSLNTIYRILIVLRGLNAQQVLNLYFKPSQCHVSQISWEKIQKCDQL